MLNARRKTLLANEIQSFESEVVDDEAEKRLKTTENLNRDSTAQHRNRRRTIVADDINKTLANGGAASSLPKPSNEQLSCLYNNCVKLLNENKINAKNAFQLKLIDYMSEIVLNKEIVGGTTNFQVVGCTIDVGTKIYAARVDALHQNTYQVLSGLGNSANENQEAGENGDHQVNNENDDDNIADDDDDGKNGKKAKNKKKRMKKSSQIAQNLDSISSKMKDEFKEEDLYFAKISTCIENEAISGILLNKLHVLDDSNRILINADDQKYSTESNHVNSEREINCQSLVDLYSSNGYNFRNAKLCADLNNFRFIDWNLQSDDISKLVEDLQNVSDQQLEEHRFDVNNKQLHNLEVGSDIGSMPIDNDLEDFGNDFDGGDVENIEMFMNGNEPAKLVEHRRTSDLDLLEKIDDIHLNSVADLTSLISHTPSDYSYFNFDKLKLQTLPKHLKQIAAHLAANRDNNGDLESLKSAKTAATARNKKTIPKIDMLNKIDRMKFFKITKKAIYLCDRTIEKRSEKPFRLETERQVDYNARQLLQPYLKQIPAKILCDIECVDNLLINDDEIVGLDRENQRKNLPQNNTNLNNNEINIDDDDDGHLGGIDDNFEIPCTAQTNQVFFSQNGGEFDLQSQQHTDMMLMPPPPPIDELNMSRLDGDNLIQAPLQVNALNIEYAKTSKNIDVRRLKQVIWSLLCNDNNKENEVDISNSESMEVSKRQAEPRVHASLRDIYRQLKPPLISQRVYDDLSICICFQMILFLANEHNLLLKNDPIGSDVTITNQ